MTETHLIYTGNGFAKDKLNEAIYFFEKLKTLKDSENINEFKYNGSAFLSAARSVTWALKKEFKKNPQFEDWYSPIWTEFKTKYHSFVTARNTALKEGAPVLRRHIEVTLLDLIELTDPVNPTDAIFIELISKQGETKRIYRKKDGQKIEPKEAKLKKTWFLRENPDKDFFEYSTGYIEKLTQIVEEANDKFKQN